MPEVEQQGCTVRSRKFSVRMTGSNNLTRGSRKEEEEEEEGRWRKGRWEGEVGRETGEVEGRGIWEIRWSGVGREGHVFNLCFMLCGIPYPIP